MKHNDKLHVIAAFYLKRNSSQAIPDGTIVNGIFTPSDNEREPCCESIRPKSMFRHCNSVTHIAMLTGVDKKQLRDMIRIVRFYGFKNVASNNKKVQRV